MILTTLSESGDNLRFDSKDSVMVRLVDMVDRLKSKLDVACDFRDYINQKICPDDNDSELWEWQKVVSEANDLLVKVCTK